MTPPGSGYPVGVPVLVPALQFAIIAAIGVPPMVIGPGWGLPLLAGARPRRQRSADWFIP